ncbi:MAG: lysine--tRNA ligase [Candidatus Marinimicrobia bacterium]|nr:lysine--tRNA ligase [Candidatus Neomarinimicrobiota bacterium]
MNNQEKQIGKSLSEILQIRKEKVRKIRELGFEPYAYSFPKSHSNKAILDNFAELEETTVVKIAGRIMAIRKMGRASFCHIQDDDTRLQIYFQEDKIGKKNYDLFRLLDIGDIIGVVGKVFKTRTGEITIYAEELQLLTKNVRPIPVVKEKDGNIFDAFTDKEQRYRQRYLDLIVNPEVKQTFKMRSSIIQWTRDFLNDHGYLEVETPSLQPIYGGASARPFRTHYNALNRDVYLRIADELYLKRLIIGGFEKVYEIAKNFRNEGIDKTHNPEFTALEFYQTYVDYRFQMDFVEELFRYIAKKIGRTVYEYGDYTIDIEKPFQRREMFDLLKEYVGVDVSALSQKQLEELCVEKDLEVNPKLGIGKMIELLFDNFVENKLVQPTFVTDYPKAISPFAKSKQGGDPEIVERFELYIAGQEFVNAFSELNDPFDQRERLENQNQLRNLGDEEAQAMDEEFVVAMEYGMPPTGGVGIGIDRMVMFFTNQSSIRDVILFPQLRT